MLILADDQLESRRRVVAAPLSSLFQSLVAELEPLLAAEPRVPATKALLSRAGGRCELDGATLEFDPWSPHQHRCPSCGTVHQGELHDLAWVTSYQLWLAERAVHAALFNLLHPDGRHASLARDILQAYATRYLEYPNRDNVLGPTRLFFSTYLESIWLLQICLAADFLRQAGDTRTAAVVIDRIIEPSSALIAEYDEGMSNRQVWNNAALLAAATLRDDSRLSDRAIDGASGFRAHLSRALLADGTWYEGENYHLFALRGLWYSAMMCGSRGVALGDDEQQRLHRAFAAPFLTALPDFTMPSRKDSQYAISLRQWRIAELTELGVALRRDPTLVAALGRCYESGHPRRDTGRARSTADVERNIGSSALTRADLGWRALLHALPELPPLDVRAPRSTLLEQQGVAVFRRPHDVYVALDYGESGGGHGHPDRLNVLFSQGTTRWLDDLGTGSYVDPSLHWYRSTLAHNAPLVDGRSQPLRDGQLLAHDEREGLGWALAQFELPESETRLERAVVVGTDYVLDELRWTSPDSRRIDLPVHLDAEPDDASFSPAVLGGGNGLEDGFNFVRDTKAARVRAGRAIELHARRDGRVVRATFIPDQDVSVFMACAPGQPATSMRRFFAARAESSSGVFRTFMTWNAAARMEAKDDATTVIYNNGERHIHRRDEKGWHVELHAAGARSSIDLDGFRPRADRRKPERPVPVAATPVRRRRVPAGWLGDLDRNERDRLLIFELSEGHYRRSEDAWRAAGSPTATIAFAADDRALVLFAHVRAGERRFVGANEVNPFDNEHIDTMGAGLQLYTRTPQGAGAWMLVPESSSDVVRVRALSDWGALRAPTARWREAPGGGYEVRVEVPIEAGGEVPIDVDVIVNETTLDRARRRGQLVLSGARGEFVYLRGDRHDPSRLIPLVVVG